ncbi:hypothetical protein H4R18_004914 [Coemansia javaensis]|uniref:C3H1-type domain-containing protein n=1 Tax=Coemansia javaensis TaxID=2761396 RepID=A0A9W8H321_9FUNG|nr:hypothetical protein H4R18_004914 [Coemansia javaensis]
MPDGDNEDLKRQIQQLELVIRQRTQQRSWDGARHNPLRPRHHQHQHQRHRPPAVRPSRNLKLTVKDSGSGADAEGFLSYGNKLVRVASGARPLRPALRPAPRPAAPAQITIDGEAYVRRGRGNNKLVRASELPARPPQGAGAQSRVVSIDGESYVRTKRGSLVRVGALRALNSQRQQRQPQHQRKRLCTRHLFGKCTAAPESECAYSHVLTPETTPVCMHFQTDSCTRAGCRFTHTKVNPNAPICRDFVHRGFCAKGVRCLHRHVLECPDWVEKGRCPRPRCRLPHPDKSRPRPGPALPTKEEEEAFTQHYIQRPTFGAKPADGAPPESSDSEDLDGSLSEDEAEELLKWYDDNYEDASKS